MSSTSTNHRSTYPVHVDAQLDPQLSRWQWLLKWLLALPHYAVLACLWLAFAVLSFVAFFAILCTGRYPRAIFDFNVGVLRWSWRVSYYAYGALGTDRYPPFSLDEKPDYPAHLEIDYPEHLSRGLVLVKWWLLAIPHYLVVALLVGGVGYAANGAGDDPAAWGFGLIGLLVLVAAVVLLFTGRYPQPLFDFVLGLNRWVLRVAAYAALMTDEYPPFRLDQGAHEPHPSFLTADRSVATSPAPAPAPPSAATHRRWTPGRVAALVAGCLVLVTSAGIGLAGGALAIADTAGRDDSGFVMSGKERFSTTTYAVTSSDLELHVDPSAAFVPDHLLGRVKVTVESGNDAPIFLGIASTDDIDDYLGGVRHASVVALADDPVYETTGTEAPATPPAAQTFWTAQASGAGEQSLTWEVEGGEWTVVVMNADGSADVTATANVGATLPALSWVVPVLLSVAGTGLVLAIVVIALTLGRGQRREQS